MSERLHEDKALRVGVFATLQDAKRAAQTLLAAGFLSQQVTVLCNEDVRHEHFAEFEHPSEESPSVAAGVRTLGAAAGGLANVVAAFASGDGSLVFSSGLGTWTDGMVEGLVGAMHAKGIEQRLAHAYHQALENGRILVAVEEQGSALQPALSTAEQILTDAGAEAVDPSATHG